MSRPGPGPVPAIPASQPNVTPATVPTGNQLNVPSAPSAGAIGRALGPGTSDQEKVGYNYVGKKNNCIRSCHLLFILVQAALIMQVLQLSDEQIALLPPDQRQSIMVLKEQIARSSR